MLKHALRSIVALTLAAASSMGMSGLANAGPPLQIVSGTGALPTPPASSPLCPALDPSQCEVTGDNGGTTFPWPDNTTPGGAGAGLPSATGGWPAGAGYGVDGSFANAQGLSGWHASYLNLATAASVTFQYMGRGNASNRNQFQVFVGGTWTTLFDNTTTPPCQTGSTSTTPGCLPGTNEVTLTLGAGLVPFRYVADIGGPNADTFVNDGVDNPDPHGTRGGFVLGIDPYVATGPFQNAGNVAYAGLTDLPGAGDHDFQDMGVRIAALPLTPPVAVPGLGHAGTLLLVAGLIAVAGLRLRRLKAESPSGSREAGRSRRAGGDRR